MGVTVGVGVTVGMRGRWMGSVGVWGWGDKGWVEEGGWVKAGRGRLVTVKCSW